MNKQREISGRVLFEEVQAPPSWVYWIMLAPFIISVALPLLLMIPKNADRREGFIVLAFVVPLQMVIFYLFRTTRFHKAVTSNGIYYRWTPLHRRYRFIEKEELASAARSKGNSLRIGISYVPGRGWMHQAGGGSGMQLELHKGKRYFLGSAHVDAFEKAVDTMRSLHPKTALL